MWKIWRNKADCPDILISAVLKPLLTLDLKANLTDKGFTVGILAEKQDCSKKFGIEATGYTESIKKSNKKLTQVLEFERIKEHNEKTILIVNTYKTIPIEERKSREHFTKEVVEFLSPHHILLMTCYNMYQMVRDVIEKNPPQKK